MSQERWDVVLRFLDGPLSYQGDIVSRGPVIRMGANPGPGGLVLDGYRGLDSVQATITAYDGGTVAITPMGRNQVRVAPHENVDWAEIQTLRAPVYLSPGDAFHLGSPRRGATAVFVECRRLGVWEAQPIFSDATQLAGSIQPTNVKEIDAQGHIPRWFIPSVLITLVTTMVASAAIVIRAIDPGGPSGPLGPQADGIEYFEYVTEDDLRRVEQSDLEGFQQAFDAFVMAPNAEAADLDRLRDTSNWDEKFYRYTVAATKQLRNSAFWNRLHVVKDDYAFVTEQLREAGLPTVFAAIPYQESQYRATARSTVCAKGYWQFMPETAHRYDLEVRGCMIGSTRWSPTARVPPSVRKSPYVYYNREDNVQRCRISSCEVDERVELEASTRAAVLMLKDSWDDEAAQSSGAGVQMTIMAHNMGYNDTQYMTSGRKYGVLDAYKAYLSKIGRDHGPDFYGDNITCNAANEDPHKPNTMLTKCDGLVPNQTQHYAYHIVAQHLLAVCYYATNCRAESAFEEWEEYTYGEGYCTQLSIPVKEC